MEVVVIGGGIIGLMTAYFLQKDGHTVTVCDQSDMTDGCSYGNAGFICPSHFIPLAAPGVINQGLKWMLDAKSPFYIQPRLNSDLLRWLYQFARHANKNHVDDSVGPQLALSLLSRSLFLDMLAEELKGIEYSKTGIAVVSQSEKGWESVQHEADRGEALGLTIRRIDSEMVESALGVRMRCAGAVIFEEDTMVNPMDCMRRLKQCFVDAGGTILTGTEVRSFGYSRQVLHAVHTSIGELKADHVVITAGVWSADLCKKLSIRLLLQAGKGYHIRIAERYGFKLPVILEEEKVVVSPFQSGTQFSGTMEITGINNRKRQKRIEGIASSVTRYFPQIDEKSLKKGSKWMGMRPLSADGLAYIGRLEPFKNLSIATGHGMLGLSQSTGTAELLRKIIREEPLPTWTGAFNPGRFKR